MKCISCIIAQFCTSSVILELGISALNIVKVKAVRLDLWPSQKQQLWAILWGGKILLLEGFHPILCWRGRLVWIYYGCNVLPSIPLIYIPFPSRVKYVWREIVKCTWRRYSASDLIPERCNGVSRVENAAAPVCNSLKQWHLWESTLTDDQPVYLESIFYGWNEMRIYFQNSSPWPCKHDRI